MARTPPSLALFRPFQLGPPQKRYSLSSICISVCTTTSSRQAHATIHTTTHRAQHPSGCNTADQKELEHFSALASTWWDAHGPSRLLHLMNPVRIDFIQRCLSRGGQPSSSISSSSSSLKKLDFLDVGCGGGILAESLARLPIAGSVTGVDPSAEIVRVAKEHARQDPLFHFRFHCAAADAAAEAEAGVHRKLRYICGTVDELGSESAGGQEGGGGKYDVVTAMEVLEHVCSPQQFLAQCAARVRPGGWLAISTIARHPVSWVTTKLLAEGVLRVVPWGTHDWSRYVNVEELREWVSRWKSGGGDGGGGGIGGGEDNNGDGGGWEVADTVVMGCVYVPGFGWKEVPGAERVGNYFFAVRRAPLREPA